MSFSKLMTVYDHNLGFYEIVIPLANSIMYYYTDENVIRKWVMQ
jgi:hypothetical protein